jgi:methanogenic corrinoid protein MtbC1
MSLHLPKLRTLLQSSEVELDTDRLVDMLAADDRVMLHHWLENQLSALGLKAFVYRIMAPATAAVGEAWASDRLDIYQEHLYTEMIQGLVHQALAAHFRGDGEPRIMLATLQGEPHSLGLLMVEVLLRFGGTDVIPFGTEMPISDIKKAAVNHEVDVIGLSFSCNFRNDEAIAQLSRLRKRIDDGTQIWVGGAAFLSGQNMPNGVKLLGSLQEVEFTLTDWRKTRTTGAGG